jgi:DNA repair ATPase RecN
MKINQKLLTSTTVFVSLSRKMTRSVSDARNLIRISKRKNNKRLRRNLTWRTLLDKFKENGPGTKLWAASRRKRRRERKERKERKSEINH